MTSGQKPPLLVETIGSRIKSLRIMCNLSRPKFCARHGIGFPALRSWEMDISTLSDKSLYRLLSAFKAEGIIVDPVWLRTGSGIAPTLTTQDKVNLNLSQAPNSLNPIQNEVDTFLSNNPTRKIITADHDYPTLNLKSGDFIGGIKINVNDLAIGQSLIVLIAYIPSTNTTPHPKEDSGLKLRTFQKLSARQVIIAPVNTSSMTWHQYVYSITDVRELYHVCWLRNLTRQNV